MNKILRLTFVALLALVSNMGFAADKDVTIDIFHDGVKLFFCVVIAVLIFVNSIYISL